MSTVEPVLAELKDEVKLALVGAITEGAARATNEERCRALRDLAQAFIFLPVRGDLPGFVHSHSGVPFSPGGGAGPAPPIQITPGQIRLEDELEEARIALVDALANLASSPENRIENSTCIVLLAEAFDLLPPPIGTMGGSGRGVPPTPPTTPAPPSLGHSHGA